MKHTFSITTTLLLFIFFSCTKENSEHLRNEDGKVFLKEGNYWIYHTYDTSGINVIGIDSIYVLEKIKLNAEEEVYKLMRKRTAIGIDTFESSCTVGMFSDVLGIVQLVNEDDDFLFCSFVYGLDIDFNNTFRKNASGDDCYRTETRTVEFRKKTTTNVMGKIVDCFRRLDHFYCKGPSGSFRAGEKQIFYTDGIGILKVYIQYPETLNVIDVRLIRYRLN